MSLNIKIWFFHIFTRTAPALAFSPAPALCPHPHSHPHRVCVHYRKPGFLMPDRLLLSLLQDGPCFINNMNAYVLEFWYPMWQKKNMATNCTGSNAPFFPLVVNFRTDEKKISRYFFWNTIYNTFLCSHYYDNLCRWNIILKALPLQNNSDLKVNKR